MGVDSLASNLLYDKYFYGHLTCSKSMDSQALLEEVREIILDIFCQVVYNIRIRKENSMKKRKIIWYTVWTVTITYFFFLGYTIGAWV